MVKGKTSLSKFNYRIFLKYAIFAITLAPFPCNHTQAQEIKFRNETADTTKITNLLIEESRQTRDGRIARLAQRFINTPYAAGTLEGDSIETLRVNLDSLDCTTFVENVIALAITANERRQSWHDFTYNLRRIRYRNGEIDGYPSRLHYVSDWILDNVSRGNIKEVTGNIEGARHNIKSLDFMTSHRSSYPALADSANFARMKSIEAGFSNHRYPYLKASSLKDKKLAHILTDGDIICFTTSQKGLDATHMAIVTIINGEPRIIHASAKAGKVLLDPLTLCEYLHRNRNEGIRVIRLASD